MIAFLQALSFVTLGAAVIVTNLTVNSLRKRIERLERER